MVSIGVWNFSGAGSATGTSWPSATGGVTVSACTTGPAEFTGASGFTGAGGGGGTTCTFAGSNWGCAQPNSTATPISAKQ